MVISPQKFYKKFTQNYKNLCSKEHSLAIPFSSWTESRYTPTLIYKCRGN